MFGNFSESISSADRCVRFWNCRSEIEQSILVNCLQISGVLQVIDDDPGENLQIAIRSDLHAAAKSLSSNCITTGYPLLVPQDRERIGVSGPRRRYVARRDSYG
jgi:hypothetical protein